MFELATSQNHRLGMLIYLAISTRMRQMELLGLKWTDVDWAGQRIKVEQQLVRPYGIGVQFAPLKTKSGRRSIDISTRTIEALWEHYNNQLLKKQSAGMKWQDHDLIFTNSLLIRSRLFVVRIYRLCSTGKSIVSSVSFLSIEC